MKEVAVKQNPKPKLPASSRKPWSKLCESDVQTSVEALTAFQQLLADVFER